ncbi:MAG: hypothetical protein ACOCPT_04315 [Halanaeroarchaeum sp.]
MGDNEIPTVRRRGVLRMIGVGAVLGAGGIGAFAGSAAAWERNDVEFKGCSEVWIIVEPADVHWNPPPVVARVIFALPDGSTTCRDVELTPDNTAPIPGQYGESPVRKVRAGEGEKVLGVIIFRHDGEDPMASPAYIFSNDHRCANTPDTPSIEAADCYQQAKENGGWDASHTSDDADGTPGGGPPSGASVGKEKGPKK